MPAFVSSNEHRPEPTSVSWRSWAFTLPVICLSRLRVRSPERPPGRLASLHTARRAIIITIVPKQVGTPSSRNDGMALKPINQIGRRTQGPAPSKEKLDFLLEGRDLAQPFSSGPSSCPVSKKSSAGAA